MNETEKRRKKLLDQTRNLYQDDRIVPAVHPRYKASYYQIYPERIELHKGTFGIRCLICIILFGAFIMMGPDSEKILGMSNVQVQKKIMHNYTFELY